MKRKITGKNNSLLCVYLLNNTYKCQHLNQCRKNKNKHIYYKKYIEEWWNILLSSAIYHITHYIHDYLCHVMSHCTYKIVKSIDRKLSFWYIHYLIHSITLCSTSQNLRRANIWSHGPLVNTFNINVNGGREGHTGQFESNPWAMFLTDQNSLKIYDRGSFLTNHF